MNTTSQNLLHTFETLPEPEQNELAAAILRLTIRDNLAGTLDDAWLIHAEEVSLAKEIEFNSIE